MSPEALTQWSLERESWLEKNHNQLRLRHFQLWFTIQNKRLRIVRHLAKTIMSRHGVILHKIRRFMELNIFLTKIILSWEGRLLWLEYSWKVMKLFWPAQVAIPNIDLYHPLRVFIIFYAMWVVTTAGEKYTCRIQNFKGHSKILNILLLGFCGS